MDNYIILPKTFDLDVLVKYYSLADLFVICSKRENFPTTCIEAQCCGTSVIGFDTGGTKETSILGEDDFVKYGDIDGLARLIREKIIPNRETLSNTAREEFSTKRMVENYINEYDKGGKKNRIMLIDVNCKYSSTGKIVYDLYSSLKSDGRSVSICYGRGEKIEEEDIFKFGLDWETNMHAALARISGYNGYFSPISTRRLIKKIEEFKPEIVHIHELHAYFVNIFELIRYLKKKKIPVVWTFHCEYMYTGKCGHANDCTGFMEKCGNCPAVNDYPKSLFFDRTRQMLKKKKEELRDLDFSIITPSRWLAERVELSFLKGRDVKVIHNGIDVKIFHPTNADSLREQLRIPEDSKVVLALAPNIMSDNKGGKWILKLAELMRNENYFFLLVGNE